MAKRDNLIQVIRPGKQGRTPTRPSGMIGPPPKPRRRPPVMTSGMMGPPPKK